MTGAWIFYLFVFGVMGIGAISTIAIGLSKSNREGNPGYFKKTGRKWTRLTLLYVICFGAAVIALLVYIYNK
jgi:peptidoglycan biosynthesis protein MviN/MurJ (putative lipid II flippase)